MSVEVAQTFTMSDEEANNPPEGWADAMSKVLGKQASKDKASTILGKTKLVTEGDEELKEKRARRKKVNKKRKWEHLSYTKPDVLEKEYEKNLQKIATRGVVQLFNVVKKHQKEMEDKLEKARTEVRKEKVMKSINKGQFLDKLKKETSKQNATEPSKNAASNDQPSWSVLRDDFMLSKEMRDWDRDTDDEVEEKKGG